MVDHALEAHQTAVFGRIDLGHAIGFQFLDLVGHDNPAAAAENLDVASVALPEQIDDVLEELHVAALVAAGAHGMGVFLDGRVDDVLHRAVVAQVDHLGSGALKDAPDDIDGRVVTVKKRCRRYGANRVLGYIRFGFYGHGKPLPYGENQTSWPMIRAVWSSIYFCRPILAKAQRRKAHI